MITMNSAARSYVKEFGGVMVAYALVLPASILAIQAHPHSPCSQVQPRALLHGSWVKTTSPYNAPPGEEPARCG